MSRIQHDSAFRGATAASGRLVEAAHLQAIECNPLTAEEIAIFEKFEREGWSPERRRARLEMPRDAGLRIADRPFRARCEPRCEPLASHYFPARINA